MPLPAVATRAAGDIEGYRADISLLDALHMRADLDHLSRVLVAHLHSLGSSEAAVINVEVTAADVGRHELENHRVLDLPALRILKLRKLPFLDLQLSRAHERDCAIDGHASFSIDSKRCAITSI